MVYCALAPAWSPDGTRNPFHGDTAKEIFVMRADGTGITSLGVSAVGRLAWSPESPQDRL